MLSADSWAHQSTCLPRSSDHNNDCSIPCNNCSQFSRADWLRAVLYQSIQHENDVKRSKQLHCVQTDRKCANSTRINACSCSLPIHLFSIHAWKGQISETIAIDKMPSYIQSLTEYTLLTSFFRSLLWTRWLEKINVEPQSNDQTQFRSERSAMCWISFMQ